MKAQKTWRIFSSASILITLLPVLILAAGSAWATGITGRTYVNEEYGFRISLPEDLKEWNMTDEEPDVGLVLMSGPLAEMLSVETEKLPVPVDLKQWVDITILIFPIVLDDWKEESRETLQIDGVDAYEIICTFAMEGIGMRCIMWLFIRDDHSYTITGMWLSFDGLLPFPADKFRSIVSTFKFLPETSTKPILPISVSPRRVLTTTWGQIKGRD